MDCISDKPRLRAIQAAEKIGFPIMMRSSFALGGLGSGVVNSIDQLYQMATVALANSPQVSILRID